MATCRLAPSGETLICMQVRWGRCVLWWVGKGQGLTPLLGDASSRLPVVANVTGGGAPVALKSLPLQECSCPSSRSLASCIFFLVQRKLLP